MEKEIGKICAEGFSFFGKTNRLISHELKNILAIISETLGLLDELVGLSEKGAELKPERLRAMSDSIIEEVERANRIIRNMNIFAHSVDEFIREVDINQIVAHIIEICQLDATLKKTKLLIENNETCLIHTSPFFLENLLYHVINFSLLQTDSDNILRVSCDLDNDGVKINFSGIVSNRISEFPTKKETILASVLSAKISYDAGAGVLSIDLPRRIGENLLQNLATDR